jgi:integrase
MPNKKLLTDANIKKTTIGDILWCPIIKGFHLWHRETKRAFYLKYKVGNKQKRPHIQDYAPPHYNLTGAREKAKNHLAAVELGQDPTAKAQSSITFAELADNFIELHCKKNLKESTFKEYVRQIENEIKPAFKNLAANEVTPQLIVQLIDTKARQAPIAANRILSTVSKLFKWAKNRQSIETNPALGIEKPGKEKQRDRVLSEREIKAFWEWTESDEFAVASNNLGDTTKYIFQLVLLTGQRPGEVCQISKHQIDFDAMVWTIPDKVHKSGRVHLVPLSDQVMAILDRVDEHNSRSVRRSERPEYFLSPRKDASVLPTVLARKVHRRGDLLDIPHWTPHDLRRTAATNISGRVLDGDQKSKRFVVARVLGHTDKEVTGIYDRYEYLEEKKAALQGWADLVTSFSSSVFFRSL